MPPPMYARLREAIVAARSRTLTAARDWRPDPELVARFADVDSLTAGEAAARALLSDVDWIAALLGPSLDRLRDDLLFDPPFRSQRDPLRAGIVLFDTPVASVTMAVIDHRAPVLRTLPDTVVVGGRVSWTRYLRAGGARLWRWRADLVDDGWHAGVAARARPLSVLPLADGAIVRIDGRRDAMLLVAPVADIVSVTVTLRHGAAPFLREYDRAGGALLRLATLDEGAARSSMLLTLLRELGQGDAAVFDAMSRDPAFFLRWDAMRAWLASDARAALPRLRAMVEDPHPEVRAATTKTLPLVEARIAGADPWHG